MPENCGKKTRNKEMYTDRRAARVPTENEKRAHLSKIEKKIRY